MGPELYIALFNCMRLPFTNGKLPNQTLKILTTVYLSTQIIHNPAGIPTHSTQVPSRHTNSLNPDSISRNSAQPTPPMLINTISIIQTCPSTPSLQCLSRSNISLSRESLSPQCLSLLRVLFISARFCLNSFRIPTCKQSPSPPLES